MDLGIKLTCVTDGFLRLENLKVISSLFQHKIETPGQGGDKTGEKQFSKKRINKCNESTVYWTDLAYNRTNTMRNEDNGRVLDAQ